MQVFKKKKCKSLLNEMNINTKKKKIGILLGLQNLQNKKATNQWLINASVATIGKFN